MSLKDFPTQQFCHSVVRFLDALNYNDDNLSLDERLQTLRYVHSRTAAFFTQPLARATLKAVKPARIGAVTRSMTHFIVFCWPKVPRDIQVDISIYFSIINLLDDEINADPREEMVSFWEDLLQGKPQKHPFWILMKAHLPTLLSHYGAFSSFNIMRSTFDYFEGCWIEQLDFRGYPGSDCYPTFLRRLNCLGGAVGATQYPAVEFDDQKLIKELSSVMAHMDGPVALMNDLFSFYKEYHLDEANLVTNWCTVDGINTDQALERLTDQTIHACVRFLKVFEDKDPKVLATVRAFIHGHVTWHMCELRYRLREVFQKAVQHNNGPDETKFCQYYEKALNVGWVDPLLWTLPPASAADDSVVSGSHVSKLEEVDAALINPHHQNGTTTINGNGNGNSNANADGNGHYQNQNGTS